MLLFMGQRAKCLFQHAGCLQFVLVHPLRPLNALAAGRLEGNWTTCKLSDRTFFRHVWQF